MITVVTAAVLLAIGIAVAIAPNSIFASNEGAGDEILCSPAVDNPYDENTMIQRCSDNNIIIDKETGEQTGNVKETPQGAAPCSEIDQEQFPGSTLDTQCINPSSP